MNGASSRSTSDSGPRRQAYGLWATAPAALIFTHIAHDDFRVIRDNLAGIGRVTTGRLEPFCLFTDPELARVGLNESPGKKSRGINVPTRKIPVYGSAAAPGRSPSHAASTKPWSPRTATAFSGLQHSAPGRRGHGDCSARHRRRSALHGSSRCNYDPSDYGGGSRGPLPGSAGTILTRPGIGFMTISSTRQADPADIGGISCVIRLRCDFW